MKVLFVHGALVRDGRWWWWWHRMVDPLAQRGLSTEAVVLPSCDGALGAAATEWHRGPTL
ncbi:MAG: hypothetical protein ACRDS9_00215 [Pseudonocardiaceae bacterium]